MKVFNIGLRAVTLASKFLLVFVLAYYVEAHQVALYGLIAATVSYALYGLGFEFYSFSTRDLLSKPKGEWGAIVKDQGVFYVFVYLAAMPMFLLIFKYGLLPWSVAFLFFVILGAEHLAQEVNRILVAMSRPLMATLTLFLRSGLWSLAVLVVFWLSPESRELRTVLVAWAWGAVGACLLGFVSLRSLDWSSAKRKIAWGWVWGGVKVAFPLLIAVLAIRGMLTLDRYWVGEFAGVELLAAYVLFVGVANAVVSFVESGVFVFHYPGVVSACKSGDKDLFEVRYINLLKQTLVVAAFLCICAAAIVPYIVVHLDPTIYSENLGVLYVLLVAFYIYCVSMVPHYAIYSLSNDNIILIINFASFLVFCLCAAIFYTWNNVYSVPLALCVGFSVLMSCKFYVFFKIKRNVKYFAREAS